MSKVDDLVTEVKYLDSSVGTYKQKAQCMDYITKGQYKEAIDVLYDILDDCEWEAMLSRSMYDNTRPITKIIDKLEKLAKYLKG